MSFNSLEFLIFLPTIVCIYWLTPQKYRWIPLLSASYYFYMSWNRTLVYLIVAITLVSYIAGRLIWYVRNPKTKKIIVATTVTICIGLLLYFKYFNFLAENIIRVLHPGGYSSDFVLWDIILPIGISFYTFQALSYVIDVYRGQINPEHHLGYYALFVSFFPQLVAGPIERSKNLLPQFRASHTINNEDIHQGLRLLISGFFRKVVIADFVGKFVTSVYSTSDNVDGGAIFIATILFSIQIYSDFAGYSEIALGSARLMGIKLMKNFDRPYLSMSIQEFWRRWHISLSTWFTDYIYIPLGGSRSGLPKHLLAIIIVFFISGLWHGAAWTFIIWGLIHSLYMIGEILITKCTVSIKLSPSLKKIRKLTAITLTYSLVTFAWIFFRSESLHTAFYFVKQLFSPWNLVNAVSILGIQILDAIQLILIIIMMPGLYKLSLLPNTKGITNVKANKLAITYVYYIMAIGISWLIQLQQDGNNMFIYFQF